MKMFKGKNRGVMFFGLFGLIVLAGLVWPSLGQSQLMYQRVPFASTANPVGSGGRALAWGGAFIAVADDATAASWNPGGLVQLVKPETSVALSYHTRQEDLSFSGFSADSDSRLFSAGNLNYASVVYPFHVGQVNMVVSLNYQRLYDFDRDLEFSASGVAPTGDIFSDRRHFQQTGALTTVTPAFCIQITPAWSVGLAVNFWGLDGDGDGWEQQYQIQGVSRDPLVAGSTVEYWAESREKYRLRGTNVVIGTHYKVKNWTFGAVYKSSFEAEVEFQARMEAANIFPLNPIANNQFALKRKKSETLVWPESYGVGVAYRYSDRLSFAVDAYTTRWSQYVLKTDKGELNLLAGNDQTADIKDTWQVRMGAEYLWITPKYVFALRGGAFFDPEPLADEVNDFYGVSLGVGLVYRNFVLDAAFQYRWANDVKSERVEGVQAETDVQDYFGIISLIYHF